MSVVEMHSSWLAINSVVGCTNNCRYCLLQSTGNNRQQPKVIATPKEAVEQLVNYKYYDKDIPICILPNTDVFLNEQNILYLLDLLKELDKRNITNDLILITKCRIPQNIIKFINKLKSKGRNIVFYISYSGLGKEIEPNISEKVLKDNFKLLRENNIDVIHYYRPFLPQNSDCTRIKEILDFVNQYTDVSVTTGLALIENFIDLIDCWEEIKQHKEKVLKANCVWPKEAWDYFNFDYKHQQQVFQTNTCGLNSKLKRASTQYYGSYECRNYNHCSEEQRERCKKAHKELNKSRIIIECDNLLKRIGYVTDTVDYCFDEYDSLEIKNIDLKISDLSYLSYKLGVKVYISTNNKVLDTYNSTLNGAKPLVM